MLIVLRGYPGYQCPFCNRQAQDFLQESQAFAQGGAHIVMVYPGPPQDLRTRAKEFVADKALPSHFDLLLDPGYEFTNLYGVRWNAPRETAVSERSGFTMMPRGVRARLVCRAQPGPARPP